MEKSLSLEPDCKTLLLNSRLDLFVIFGLWLVCRVVSGEFPCNFFSFFFFLKIWLKTYKNMWFYQQSVFFPPNPKMSLNVLFCPQPKDIEFTVTLEEKRPEHIHIQEAGNERNLTFIPTFLFQFFFCFTPQNCSLCGWRVIDEIVYWLIDKKSVE